MAAFTGVRTRNVLADLLVSETATSTGTSTKRGFVKEGNYTFYYDSDGTRHKGWLTLNGKKYYFVSWKGSDIGENSWIEENQIYD